MIQLLYLYMILKKWVIELTLCIDDQLIIVWKCPLKSLLLEHYFILFYSGWTGKRQKNNLDCHILCCMVTSECYICSNFLRNFISVCAFYWSIANFRNKTMHLFLLIYISTQYLKQYEFVHSKNLLTWTLINSFL